MVHRQRYMYVPMDRNNDETRCGMSCTSSPTTYHGVIILRAVREHQQLMLINTDATLHFRTQHCRRLFSESSCLLWNWGRPSATHRSNNNNHDNSHDYVYHGSHFHPLDIATWKSSLFLTCSTFQASPSAPALASDSRYTWRLSHRRNRYVVRWLLPLLLDQITLHYFSSLNWGNGWLVHRYVHTHEDLHITKWVVYFHPYLYRYY